VAKVKSSVSNDETGFKVLALKHLLECSKDYRQPTGKREKKFSSRKKYSKLYRFNPHRRLNFVHQIADFLVYWFIVVRMCIQSFVWASMLIQTDARQICSHDSGANSFENIASCPVTEVQHP
jgi:hypothetical protein